MRKKWMILAACLFFFAGCGENGESRQCYEEGIAALEEGEYDAAISCFERLIEEGELLAESYRGYGIAWMEKECYPEAIAAFSRSLNNLDGNHPEFKADVMFYLAQLRWESGELEKAITVYSDILKDDSTNAEAFFLRGKAYLEQKDFENAGKDFVRALADCKDYNLYINIYQLFADLGMSTEGNTYLQMALELKPKTGEDYYHRGRIYECQNLYLEAKEALQKSLELEYEDAMLLLGRIYLKLEDSASARQMYQDYLNKSAKKAKAYNALAQCEIYDGDYDRALAYIKEGLAVSEGDENQALLYNEIVAYEYKKEFQTAKQKMEAYLQKYPEDTQAIRENEFLSTR